MLTQERLKKLLSYDPETGLFTRLVRTSNCVHVGDVAGSPNSKGYWHIMVEGILYKSHRLAWLYMTGAWPESLIDHADRDPGNNRWANIREATPSQNQGNTKISLKNKSGAKGVSWISKQKKWKSSIRVGGKDIHLGFYDCPALASVAYQMAAINHFGEFARTS